LLSRHERHFQASENRYNDYGGAKVELFRPGQPKTTWRKMIKKKSTQLGVSHGLLSEL